MITEVKIYLSTHYNFKLHNDCKYYFLKALKWFMNFTLGDIKDTNNTLQVTKLFSSLHNQSYSILTFVWT